VIPASAAITRDLADRRALPRVEQPRPQLDRLVTLTAMLPPGQLEQLLGHDVEDKDRARKPLADCRDQLMDLVPLEVREQALSGNQHWLRRIQLVEPAQVECRPGMAALSRTLRQHPAAKIQGRREVDTQPAHTAVVQPPELGLKAFAERNHHAGRMRAQEATHRDIERSYPDRMPPGTPRGVREVVLEPVGNLYGERVLQHRSTRARCGGASTEIPQQRLRHPGQVDGYRLHPRDGNGAAVNSAHRGPPRVARWKSCPSGWDTCGHLDEPTRQRPRDRDRVIEPGAVQHRTRAVPSNTERGENRQRLQIGTHTLRRPGATNVTRQTTVTGRRRNPRWCPRRRAELSQPHQPLRGQ
jgi:hypothetical protein